MRGRSRGIRRAPALESTRAAHSVTSIETAANASHAERHALHATSAIGTAIATP